MLTHCTVALHVMGSFVQVCSQRGLAYLCLAAPCKVTVIVCYGSGMPTSTHPVQINSAVAPFRSIVASSKAQRWLQISIYSYETT